MDFAQVLLSAYSPRDQKYGAPELCKEGMAYDEKTDVWALGCVLHELVSGQPAFCTQEDVLKYVQSNERLDFAWLETLGWLDFDQQHAVRTMLNGTLAVRTYFHPSAANIVEMTRDITRGQRADNMTHGQDDMWEQ